MIEDAIGYIQFIINDSEYNKEVLEHFIDKLNELNDSIKARVETSLLPSSTGGRHGA